MAGRIQRASEDVAPRLALPRIGKIKIGMKSPKGYPMSVDYFIPQGKYAALFTQAYGEKPNTIQIVFPSNDPEQVCCERYEYRDDEGKLVAYGDGREFHVWSAKAKRYAVRTTDDTPDVMSKIAQMYPNKAVREGGDGWRVKLTLHFIIPMVRGVAGVWAFETNGTASTIPQVRDAFDLMAAQRGTAAGVIFDLNVQFATTQKPNDRSRFPVVTLVANESSESVRKIKEAYKPVKELTE